MMNTSQKDYQMQLGDILSITTGCLLSRRGIAGVYAILNHMTGDNLGTHQLPRVSDECKTHLLTQLPQLATIEVPNFENDAHWLRWLAEQDSRKTRTERCSASNRSRRARTTAAIRSRSYAT